MLKPIHVPSIITNVNENGTKNVFISHEKLGQGGFAAVYRVTHKNTNKVYAMKVISKERYASSNGNSSLEKLKNEIQIQKTLNHPNIVQSRISFSDDSNYYMALEYCPGKTIREYLKNNSQGRLSEPETRKILKDVINGLIFLHNRHIIHHDLKLENFIIGSDGRVKIADFGLATFHKDDEDKNLSICGTPNYMSPEILLKKDKGNGFASDVWAIGITAYTLLTGKAPFSGISREIVYEKIKNCVFNFPSSIQISYEAREFIKSILKFDPSKRPTASELLIHPFIKKYDPEPIQLYKPIQTNPQIQSFTPSPTKRRPMPTPSMKDNVAKYGKALPQTPSNNRYGITKRSPNIDSPLCRRILDDSDDIIKKPSYLVGQVQSDYENKEANNSSSNSRKNFSIPSNFVTKHLFIKKDLCYMLGNGIVGACFDDKSRIVMDPNEAFVQYYTNYSSLEEVFEIDNSIEFEGELHDKISLVKNIAKAFKKYRNLYEVTKTTYLSSIPLHFISRFTKMDDLILFKFNNKNVQANFKDSKKLIIFWNTKKMCFFKDIKEKSRLLDPADVTRMNANSDELRKYKRAKEMLNTLARHSS